MRERERKVRVASSVHTFFDLSEIHGDDDLGLRTCSQWVTYLSKFYLVLGFVYPA